MCQPAHINDRQKQEHNERVLGPSRRVHEKNRRFVGVRQTDSDECRIHVALTPWYFARLETSRQLWVRGMEEGLVKRTGSYVLSRLARRHMQRQFFDRDGVKSSYCSTSSARIKVKATLCPTFTSICTIPDQTHLICTKSVTSPSGGSIDCHPVINAR